MAIRYYPSTKIKKNQRAILGEFTLNGIVYSGSYYSTYDGKYFAGSDPILGSNEELIPVLKKSNLEYNTGNSTENSLIKLNIETSNIVRSYTRPISYYPAPGNSDYSRGYMNRYFVKRSNQRGYVMEISETEYQSITNGTATYDISFYQVVSVIWKLTGPMNSKRISQYQVREGIIDTNKRIIESLNKSFPGLKEYVGEDYSKFAKSTE